MGGVAISLWAYGQLELFSRYARAIVPMLFLVGYWRAQATEAGIKATTLKRVNT